MTTVLVTRGAGYIGSQETAARRPGDASALVADSAALRRTLGWTPRHNDLDYIVRTA